MKQVDSITTDELFAMAENMYGSFVKGVVDLDKGLLVLDTKMHFDAARYLMDSGSLEENLWGINLYPIKYGIDDFIEFDSMINIKPALKNKSRFILREDIKQRIRELVNQKVIK